MLRFRSPQSSRDTDTTDTEIDSTSQGTTGNAPTDAAPNFERVTLAIKGLKCGCCEYAISKAISRIPAIRHHQINIVLARVEFELNMNRFSVAEVIKELHGATGYTFQEFTPHQGAILEFLVNDAPAFCRLQTPSGVTLVEPEDKRTWIPSRLFSCCNSTINLNAPVEEAALVERHGTARESATIETVEPPRVGSAAHDKAFFQQSVLVHYNAREIGARDIERYYKDACPTQELQLASAKLQPCLAIAAQQLNYAMLILVVTTVFTIPILVLSYGITNRSKLILPHVALVLATLVQLIAIKEFFPRALRSLIRAGHFEMDLLIALSTSTAYIFSVTCYVFQVLGHPLEVVSFFETFTLMVTLILFGRIISEAARYQAAKSVSFRSLQNEKALLVVDGGIISLPYTKLTDARLLQYGDRFEVRPYTRIVTDGQVVQGGSEVDESMITGETFPVAKGRDSRVYAGTVNKSGRLIVDLTALPHENTVSKIASMIDSKPRVQAIADKFVTLFVPLIACIGLITFLTWLLRERLQKGQSCGKAVTLAITYAIATLTVSCPCVIALAVPMVILIAGGVAARHGIIFRDPQKLEVAHNVTDAVFDKTGTLTCGALDVVKAEFYGDREEKTRKQIVEILRGVPHPAAVAVHEWLINDNPADKYDAITANFMTDIKIVPGKGVEGLCIGVPFRVGSPAWLGIAEEKSDHTIVCVAFVSHTATFYLKDRVRPAAKSMLRYLRARGINIHMISGDKEGPTNVVANALELSKDTTCHSVLPQHKQSYVQSLQRQGRTVIFIGGGTNNAAALAQADVGVHIDTPFGSDHAKEAADVVLMNPSKLHDVLILLDISKAAYRRIILNFVWSAFYNISAILLASGAFGIRIAPQFAGLGELVSVLPVVLVGFQLRARDFGKKYRSG
ncbi:heavy metal translocatin [Massarina eburnea CBS 473.64]|uniref:Heavy metal translocatin n=1 Tax=Massarina eburnea CBS 473.64 TaxID=1395130 RepID=A0A6A6S8R2_9PLEO|nr:heavy metal translocatin [Massarina eburnea CBS 473.64]